MFNARTLKRQKWTAYLGILLAILLIVASILACGGSTIGIDIEFAPENVRIEGLPQFVCPTATPLPTHTQPPTVVQPTNYATAGGYVTYTPVPHATLTPSGGTVIPPLESYTPTATHTPVPGGIFTTPEYSQPGATSTPRPTYTPYPTPTPYTSTFFYYFDEAVYTDHAASALRLRLQIGDVRVVPSTRFSDKQITIFAVEVTNHGDVFYVLLAPIQIYVAVVDSMEGGWWVSGDAAREAGIELVQAATDGVQINPGDSLRFEMAAYVPAGPIDAIAWILDPFANGYDGRFAGGNVAYWIRGSRADCVGRIGGTFTPLPNLTPNPTATLTPTIRACRGAACATVMP